MLHKSRTTRAIPSTTAISLLIGLSIMCSGHFVTQLCGDVLRGPATPKQIVEAYCRADFDGAFLSTEGYTHSGIDRYILPSEKEGPAWDMIVIINNYKILKSSQRQEEAEVPVRYDVLGQEEGGINFHPERKNESYVFHLKKISGAWKLIGPIDLPPHVSVNATIRDLKSVMESQKEVQPEIPRLIKEIEGLKSKK